MAVWDEWRALAGCAGTDLDAFFTPDPVEGYRVALAVCRRCAVRGECLDAAMVEEADESRRYGVRGGLLASQRAGIAQQSA